MTKEKDTSKRESAAAILARIDERLNNHIENSTKGLNDILEQTKMTNGRVTKLEVWKSKAQGAWAVILIVAAASGSLAAIIVQYFRG